MPLDPHAQRPPDPDIDTRRVVLIVYRNHRGVTSARHIVPHCISFGTSPWHPEPQWLMSAFDLGKGDVRTFALKDVLSWLPRATMPTEVAQFDPCV